ncbi:hypothetical protein PIB30_072194 [Stylosanthes scabra]|uniref:Uncharacterized protein n=1 Tax=Stylosanthes scabra TaxID=79078 RepID=A0ABU6YQU2_9FABA|nr:hypothetical protein [Stylosanthes scabra]
MPGRSSVDCVRPPRVTTSGGHCTGRAFVDSWISGGDHQRGPIITQQSSDFNESTSVRGGPAEGYDNSRIVENQQQEGSSGSGDGRPYKLRKKKKKPSKWSPSPWVKKAKDVVLRKK